MVSRTSTVKLLIASWLVSFPDHFSPGMPGGELQINEFMCWSEQLPVCRRIIVALTHSVWAARTARRNAAPNTFMARTSLSRLPARLFFLWGCGLHTPHMHRKDLTRASARTCGCGLEGWGCQFLTFATAADRYLPDGRSSTTAHSHGSCKHPRNLRRGELVQEIKRPSSFSDAEKKMGTEAILSTDWRFLYIFQKSQRGT